MFRQFIQRLGVLMRERQGLVLLLVVAFVTVLRGWPNDGVQVDYADSAQYLAAAYHLAHEGVFAEAGQKGPVSPGLGREPGYPFLLSLVMRVDPAFAHYDPACLALPHGCGPGVYHSMILLNGLLIALAGLMAHRTVALLGGGAPASWLAGAHIWLNGQASKSAAYALSDYLSLALVAAVGLAAVAAWRRPHPLRWALAGLAAASLVLVKAVFLYAVLAGLLVAVVLGLVRRLPLAGLAACLVAFALAFAVPVGSWMGRNAALGGGWAVSVGRTATILSTREVFDHMTPGQYATAFLYWTRGSGDDLARKYLPESLWGPFELYRPDGFYYTGQLRVDPMIRDLVLHEGLSLGAAEKRATADMIRRIAARPVSYVLSTLPVFWRGIWIDEFIVLSLPALAWLLVKALRERRPDILLALGLGLYSLFFYALISLNIARYQITALPALAVATGFGAAALIRSRRALLRPLLARFGRAGG